MSTGLRYKIWLKFSQRMLRNILFRVENRPRISKFIWQIDYIDQLSPAELKLGLSLATDKTHFCPFLLPFLIILVKGICAKVAKWVTDRFFHIIAMITVPA